MINRCIMVYSIMREQSIQTRHNIHILYITNLQAPSSLSSQLLFLKVFCPLPSRYTIIYMYVQHWLLLCGPFYVPPESICVVNEDFPLWDCGWQSLSQQTYEQNRLLLSKEPQGSQFKGHIFFIKPIVRVITAMFQTEAELRCRCEMNHISNLQSAFHVCSQQIFFSLFSPLTVFKICALLLFWSYGFTYQGTFRDKCFIWKKNKKQILCSSLNTWCAWFFSIVFCIWSINVSN